MQPRLTAGAVLLLLMLAAPATAQVPGLPVYGGGFSSGLTFGGTVGFAPSDSPSGKGVAYAGSATLGVGPIGLTGIVSRFDPSSSGREAFTQAGGLLTWKAFGGPLIPLALYLQGGFSRREDDSAGPGNPEVTRTSIPVGAGISLVIPSVIVAIKPWIAPRLQISRTSVSGNANTDTDLAFSAGVDLTTLSGFGFRAMGDIINGSDPIVGVGLTWAIRVPGL